MERIYFFHNGKECKIGCTEKDIQHRLWAAHVWSPFALEIIGWVTTQPGMKYVMEKTIHLKLAHLRLIKPSGNGEWFAISKAEAIQIIKKYEGHENNYTYGHASRHPAHTIRPLCGRQQNQTADHGQILRDGGRAFGNSGAKRLLVARSAEHAIGSQAFLRKAGA